MFCFVFSLKKRRAFTQSGEYFLSCFFFWAKCFGCQDLSHICAVTQSFPSAVCLCLRGANSNEVLTVTFLSRCCLRFCRKQETCVLRNHIQPRRQASHQWVVATVRLIRSRWTPYKATCLVLISGVWEKADRKLALVSLGVRSVKLNKKWKEVAGSSREEGMKIISHGPLQLGKGASL